MVARIRSFIAANALSPVVYFSAEGASVTYRLADGKLFRLSSREARDAGPPRLEHLEIAA